MSAKKNRPIAIFFITMLVCIGLAQPSFSTTTLSLDATGPLADIASFNFTILAPDAATVLDFALDLPAGWLPLSSGDVVSALDTTSVTSLPSGEFGTSPLNLTLGLWVFGTQGAVSLVEGVDYNVNFEQAGGNNIYSINPVPIPSAVLLLGTGLVALLGTRRRMRS